MQAFTIHSSNADGGLRYRHTTVDTAITNGAATAKVTHDSGITNPLHILTTGAIGTGLFRPDITSKQRTHVLEGTGSSPLDDAVSALQALGDRHRITGINLSTNPSLTGSVEFQDKPGMYVSGGDTAQRAGGPDALRAIDEAARIVLDLAAS